jgi:polysaccharide export outer membrane protein
MFPVIVAMLFLFSSCSSCRPCYDFYDIFGADEFVVDSYRIREGKEAILELEGICLDPLPPDAMEEYVDQIAEDDILNIVVYHPTRRDMMEAFQFINAAVGGFRVHDGQIELPDITPVPVAGLTLDEAKEVIQDRLSEEVKDVEVFITYRDRLTRKVEITGLTAVPTVPVDGKMRLYEVIARSHIAPNANLFMSYVLRDDCPLNVDLHKLINLGDMSQNIVMRGGDKIYIANPNDCTVMVMGEVGHPKAIQLPYGFMSLREAIVTAGGIPYTGDKNCIQVIRGNLQCPKIYVLSWNHIIHLPNDSLLLMPGDTIYVSAKPITEWNRFIDQLLPSFGGVEAVYGIYKISQ